MNAIILAAGLGSRLAGRREHVVVGDAVSFPDHRLGDAETGQGGGGGGRNGRGQRVYFKEMQQLLHEIT